MKIEVEDIYSFDNSNGKGISGKVNFLLDYDPSTDVRVWVTIDYDKDATLQEIENRLISAAKEKIKKIV